MLSARFNNLKMIKYFVDEAGADLLKANEKGANIFHSAACLNSMHILDYAISKR
jgi:hypothetical protein